MNVKLATDPHGLTLTFVVVNADQDKNVNLFAIRLNSCLFRALSVNSKMAHCFLTILVRHQVSTVSNMGAILLT